jgi:preprotein translocase subunit SecG
MKIWAILFALVILAAITLIVVVLIEESGQAHSHAHAVAQSLRSWIA